MQDADSLNDEFSLRLRSTEVHQSTGSARYRGTVIDDDPLANGDVQPHRHQDLRGERGRSSASVVKPPTEGRELSHAALTPEATQNIVLQS